MPLFKSLFHVTLFVNDINATLEFYEKMGFKTIFQIPEDKSEPGWNYYMKIADGQYLEIQPTNSTNPHPHPKKSQYYENQTVWHFALETDDIDNMIKTLLERGIVLYLDPEKSRLVTKPEDVFIGQDGCRICWVIDPDGTPIELMEQTGLTLQKKYDPESYR